MKKPLICVGLAMLVSGCVWTQQTSEVIVHKNAEGKVIGIDYSEKLEQSDMLPWSKHFGKYLYNQ